MKLSLSLNGKHLAQKTSYGNLPENPIIYMQTSPDVRRYKESAFVMITCEDEQDLLVLEALQSISEIKEIQHTYGNYDIIVKIETDTVKSLRDLINLRIKKIDKIRATTTLISSPILDI